MTPIPIILGIIVGSPNNSPPPDYVRSALADAFDEADYAVLYRIVPVSGTTTGQEIHNASTEACELVVAALRSPIPNTTVSDEALIEVWNGNRKVTVYKGEVLRIWGADIEDEMSSEQRSIETVQSAFNWLFGAEP